MKKIMKKRFSLEWLMGVILGVISSGVFVVRTQSFGETIKVLEKLNERVSKKRVKKVTYKRAKESNDIDDERVAMLCGVNGIGSVKALKLLEEFGSVRDIVNAEKSDLVKILGNKVGSHFYEVVNKSD